MSTPEEQQRRQYAQQQHQQHQQHQQDPQQEDPYGTQTWQSDTWDTSYQPVHPPLGAVPGQPVAPEGWFRDEAPAAPEPYRQPAAADGWYRDEPQAPAAAPVQDWPQGAAETAYLPPYPGPEQQHQPQHEPQYQQPVAPEGWFRDEPQAPAPAAAPVQDWPQGAAETAYLPPYPGPEQQHQPQHEPQHEQPQQEPPVEQTAYLPPQAAADPAGDPAAEAPGEPQEITSWSPPTLSGNTLRAVDPAQARAEGRSPIIDPGPQSAILTAVLGLLLAVAAALGQYALLLPLIALQGLTAAGWFRLNGMWPARQGIALAFAGALVADAAVLAVDPSYGPGAIVGTLGAWVLLTLVLQLRSHADPDERMYGLMASVASAALAIICAGYLAADSAAATVGAAAVAVAVFARALPLPTAPSVGVSLAAAAGAGIAIGGMTPVGTGGALIGLAAGVCALVGLRVAAYDYPSKFVHMTAGVALPLAAAAPAVYLIGRVVG
ncbi:hypothetical protein GCM10010425_63890 [Streptomyces spororaveus]|uniref:Membrane protein YfcA n=1 Tax=Streptomyces spororaveus TaxID=284039 RepID=A0ABQ3TFX3_9ACTN|nr:hypothetical protein [Streptomyces spororaveus]GHI79315.1 hypothetical protein Sspor_48760 [Streptomyces spororaveus]